MDRDTLVTMGRSSSAKLVSVSDASTALGVSESTVWRLIRRGALASVRREGRRLIPRDALLRRAPPRAVEEAPAVAAHPPHLPPPRARLPGSASRGGVEGAPSFDEHHPIFRLVGAGRGGGQGPGARDKHAI